MLGWQTQDGIQLAFSARFSARAYGTCYNTLASSMESHSDIIRGVTLVGLTNECTGFQIFVRFSILSAKQFIIDADHKN